MRIADRALDAGPATGLLDLARSASTRRPATVPVQVVILAAGMGTRLGRPHPKPLTPLHDGRSILQRQLDTLRAVLGPAVDVTVVVGFKAKRIMRAAPDVRFVYNPDYARTNTSQSLLRALRATRDGGVLWLNGDVVFDPAVLEAALPSVLADESFVCVDTSTVADEEVKYTLDGDGCIAELSKTVTGGLGEAVGINYVSAADKPVLVEHLAACAAQDYFERGIETAIGADGLRVRPVDISRFSAVEVDFETDLQRANELFSNRAMLHPVPDTA
ncbi:NTP transferase domain-containing protein [Trujillonella humicola]|uniref:phosphocholine cytidylyltransferase family protein n=1 Tax=Trujillonella humicola TaxID=3383699 RepID=UPI003905D230